MKCGNPITIAHYKNGKSVIEGSQSIMLPRIEKYNLNLSINGYYEHVECDGDVVISIYAHGEMYENQELEFDFRCNKCGIMHELNYSIEDLENIINKNI